MPYTDEQIREVMDDFFDTMNHVQYVGARYAPIFGRKDEESIVWDNSKPYEPLTIVTYQGSSYTSRQEVPTGIEITNALYWAETGNWNAQIEAYRQEVERYRQQVESYEDDITDIQSDIQGINTAIEGINGDITSLQEADEALDDKINGVKGDLDVEALIRANADSAIEDDIDDIEGWMPSSFKNKQSIVDYPCQVGIATTTGGNVGHSTQWYFRKWENGMAECWGCRPEEANINQAYGEIFENYQTMWEVFPTGLFIEAPLYVNTTWSGTWANVETAGGVTKDKSQDFKLWRATEAEVSGYVYTYAIGRWK